MWTGQGVDQLADEVDGHSESALVNVADHAASTSYVARVGEDGASTAFQYDSTTGQLAGRPDVTDSRTSTSTGSTPVRASACSSAAATRPRNSG